MLQEPIFNLKDKNMKLNEFESLLEVDFTSKVKIDPNVVSSAQNFESMTLTEKLIHLNKMYLAGQRLLKHVNSQKETTKTNSETGETTTHFSVKEKMQIRMRVLTGFKQLKALTRKVLDQLDQEESELRAMIEKDKLHE